MKQIRSPLGEGTLLYQESEHGVHEGHCYHRRGASKETEVKIVDFATDLEKLGPCIQLYRSGDGKGAHDDSGRLGILQRGVHVLGYTIGFVYFSRTPTLEKDMDNS